MACVLLRVGGHSKRVSNEA